MVRHCFIVLTPELMAFPGHKYSHTAMFLFINPLLGCFLPTLVGIFNLKPVKISCVQMIHTVHTYLGEKALFSAPSALNHLQTDLKLQKSIPISDFKTKDDLIGVCN